MRNTAEINSNRISNAPKIELESKRIGTKLEVDWLVLDPDLYTTLEQIRINLKE
jgi:hypothetical protein